MITLFRRSGVAIVLTLIPCLFLACTSSLSTVSITKTLTPESVTPIPADTVTPEVTIASTQTAQLTVTSTLQPTSTLTPEEAKFLINSYYPQKLKLDNAGECLPSFVYYNSSNYVISVQTNSVVLNNTGVAQQHFPWLNGNTYATPLTVADWGMRGLAAWCQNQDDIGLRIAFRQAQWFLDTAVIHDNYAIWVYPFASEGFNAPANWTSSFGNAFAIALLTQMYALTKDPVYLNMAKLGVNAYDVDVKDGGVKTLMDDGQSVFFEEVAHPQALRAHILNGHMFGVQGLAYFADYTGDETALRLVDEGLDSLQKYLPQFDASIISLYQLSPVLSSYLHHYAHEAHIMQIEWAYERTRAPIFLEYALRWQNYTWPALDMNIYASTKAEGESLIAPNNLFGVSKSVNAFTVDLKKVVPLYSFGYSSHAFITETVYPTDYTISISEDGITWQDMVQAKDYNKSHGIYNFDNRPTRFIRFIFTNAIGPDTDNIAFYIRADDNSYWQEPIILLVDRLAQPSSWVLEDNDTDTGLTVNKEFKIYIDSRQPVTPAQITLEGDNSDGSSSQWKASVSVSNNLVNWTTLVPEDTPLVLTLPGVIELPKSEHTWQYFQLYLQGESSFYLTSVTIK